MVTLSMLISTWDLMSQLRKELDLWGLTLQNQEQELHVDVVDGKECLTLANVNELLIKEGHAVEYHGGKR